MNLKKDIYNITITSKADNYLKRLGKNDLETIIEAIKEIPNNPFKYKTLHGNFKGARRLRKGKFRVVFYVNKNSIPPEIRIFEIGLRKNIYK